ncbi:MAG: T6SS immunity protein Tli4 family protein [Sinobacteraceae bacterium]|nr:T6SS immunity protein Tli4 family protein [Nevskiaceae bacterium]
MDAGHPPVDERFTLVITLPDHPDVLFSIEANAIEEVDKEEPSLKHRVNDELRMMRANYAGAIHVLERGKLEAAGQKGYQVAISAPYDVVPGTQIRKFFWSADGVPNDVTRPFMEVDLTIQPTDDGRSTIHSDAEAKALWEQLIGSLRIRPGAVQR